MQTERVLVLVSYRKMLNKGCFPRCPSFVITGACGGIRASGKNRDRCGNQ